MKYKRLLASVLFLCTGSLLIAHAGKNQASSDELLAADAVALMRTINTAEAEISITTHLYIPLNQLLETRFFKGRQVLSNLNDDAVGTLKNYTLSVIASADGKHYQVKLVPAKGCGVSFFTSDPGIIYQAQAFGCNEK